MLGTVKKFTLKSGDRLLIVAPHPDDETIAVGGVIQKALELKVPVKVVYLTNGDNNELSFFIYKRRPILSKAGLMKMGETRRQEAIAAMEFLGVKRDSLIFLGYPDLGLLRMMTQHWRDAGAYQSLLTRAAAVPYQHAFCCEAPHKAESVLNDLKKILSEFKPTKVFATCGYDTNSDHIALYLFMRVALGELRRLKCQLYLMVIHVLRWPMPRGFYPRLELHPPAVLASVPGEWFRFDLTPAQIEKKNQAIAFYESQNFYKPKYLYSFVRKNELFATFDDVVLTNTHGEVDWETLKLEQSRTDAGDFFRKQRNIRATTLALKNGFLFIHFTQNRWTSKFLRVNVFLLGFRHDQPFSAMPKIRLNISFNSFLKVYNNGKRIPAPGIQTARKKNDWIISVPLSSLGNPEIIFNNTRTYLANVSLASSPWRTLVIHKG